MLVKKTSLLLSVLGLLFLWSCSTYQPPPPSYHIEDLPARWVSQLSLDERIMTEDAWDNLRSGNTRKARKLLAKLGSRSPFYHAGQAYAALISRDLRTAENLFRTASDNFPSMPLGFVGLAQIHLDRGELDEAFTALRQVLKIQPEHPWAKPRYENIKIQKTEQVLDEAKTLRASGNTEASREAFLRVLYYSPDSVEAHLALAEIFINEENYQTALVHLKTAAEKEPDNLDIVRVYADTLFKAENYSASMEAYENIAEVEPDNRNVQERLQTIKNRLGIYELPSQFDAIPLSEAVSKEEVAALLSIKFKNVIDDPPPSPPIIIDISTSWAAKYIIQTTSLGLLDVNPNHTFQPKRAVTRAEMAEILYRLTEGMKEKGITFIQQIPPSQIQITDVSRDNFYYQPIIAMISYDIMALASDKTFNPDVPVSGQEAIKYLDIMLALIK
jgi:tetratricopeptide (TPR) repeat protein